MRSSPSLPTCPRWPRRVPPHRLISVLEAEHGTLDTRVQDALASAVQQPLFGPLSHGTYAKRVLDAVLRRVMARGGDVSDFFADVITSWAGGDNPSVVPPPGVEREGMLWRTLTWLPEKGSGACEHVHGELGVQGPQNVPPRKLKEVLS